MLRWLVGVTGLPLHRNVLHGALDVGDIGGLPDVMIEVKAGKPALASWLRELDRQTKNLGATSGFVVWRTPGTTDPAEWIVISRAGQWLKPRYPVPGPIARLPYYARRCRDFANAGVNYVGANVGFRCDGFMPASVDDCDAVAMTGGGFETWLGDNLDPHAFDNPVDRLTRAPLRTPTADELAALLADPPAHGHDVHDDRDIWGYHDGEIWAP